MEAMRCRGEATPPAPVTPELGPPLPVGAVVAVLDSSGDKLEDGRRMLCRECGIKRPIEFSADLDMRDKLLLPVSPVTLLLRSPFSLELRRNDEDLFEVDTVDLILLASRSELSSSLLTLPAPVALLGSDRSCGKPLLTCCCCPVVVDVVD